MTKPLVAEQQMVRERPLPTAAYVSGGATIALAIGGAFFGALSLQKHSDFVSANDGFHVQQATSDRSTGQTLNIVTDAFFGAAVIGAGITTYLVLTRATVERPATMGRLQRSPPSRLLPSDVSPALGAHTAGANAAWRF
jgi:hypothetical protein